MYKYFEFEFYNKTGRGEIIRYDENINIIFSKSEEWRRKKRLGTGATRLVLSVCEEVR